jgi:cysteine desulfurase
MKAKYAYLDYASTTPIDPKVLGSMLPYLKSKYGNPSSLHSLGRTSKDAVEKSRAIIAGLIDAKPKEIIFTSGGTESDNLAIIGLAHAYKEKGKHIIVSAIEHKAVLDACKKLEREGFRVTYLKVNKSGLVSIDHLRKSITRDTILISIMYANNEIGAIQPIKKISKMIKDQPGTNTIFHCDSCQAAGALPINVKDLGVDAMTISASKIYGPKGIGCLYLNEKIFVEPIIVGGGQEKNLRSGTENVASIVGFSEALIIAEKKRFSENKRLTKLRDYFFSQIRKEIPGVLLNGGIANRLPNNINISIPGVEGESLILMLDKYGVYCSTGSACSSQDLNPSHVLVEIGIPLGLAHCSVRFTLGRYTTRQNINYAVSILKKSVAKIRSITSIQQ